MNTAEIIHKKVSSYIVREKLFDYHTPILCAVSGGIDSVVMTRILNKLGYRLAIAHCNFQLRGKAAVKDEEFVMKIAEEMNIPFHSTRFDTASHAHEKKISIQMAARELRYEWLEQIRKENGYHFIATAHHLNDSIETVLLNILKGTGTAGLTGIAAHQGTIRRPMLCLTKKEIEQYAEYENIPFRIDASNQKNLYERNQIRNKIIPLLREINPSLEETFQRNLQHWQDAHQIVQIGVIWLKKKLIHQKKGNYYIPIKKLLLLPGWQTVFDNLLSDFGFTHAQSKEALKLIDTPSGKYIENKNYRLIKDREMLIISPRTSVETAHPIYVIDEVGKKIKTPWFTLKTEIKKFKGIQNKSPEWFMQLDADKIKFPLILRPWKPGDYFYPLGMNKKKKISDFLIDEKIPIPEKENTYVLVSDEKQIIAVLGKRIDDRFKTTNNTNKTLIIKLKQKCR